MNMDLHRYDDMLDLEHPTSKKHIRMSLLNRAAQFAPFAALTGFDGEVKETARLTDAEIYLTEDAKLEIDTTLQKLMAEIDSHPEIEVTYFSPDAKKEGGSYETTFGKLKKIDTYTGELIFFAENGIANGTKVQISRILSIYLRYSGN